MQAVRLFFHGGLHVGDNINVMESVMAYCPSDTLYAAMYQAMLELGIEPEIPVHSSAFPFVGDTFYLPCPRLRVPGFDDAQLRQEHAKTLKQVRFIEHKSFSDWIHGKTMDFVKLKEYQEVLQEAMTVVQRPRVSLDSLNMTSSLYKVGEVRFNRRMETGLYFLVHDSAVEGLLPALRWLGDEGIGGERSVGYGHFSFDVIPFPVQAPEKPELYISLSLCFPRESELSAMNSYTLIDRRGWTYSPSAKASRLRRPIVMIAEGSTFDQPVHGMIVNVQPDDWPHPVYRDGRAFLIGSKGC